MRFETPITAHLGSATYFGSVRAVVRLSCGLREYCTRTGGCSPTLHVQDGWSAGFE